MAACVVRLALACVVMKMYAQMPLCFTLLLEVEQGLARYQLICNTVVLRIMDGLYCIQTDCASDFAQKTDYVRHRLSCISFTLYNRVHDASDLLPCSPVSSESVA